MAEKNSSKGDRRQSRLQRRAPASIQVNPATSFAAGWKVAIPLLSPLVSPTSPPAKFGEQTLSSSQSQINGSAASQSTTEKANMKAWQHPAAPFHYDPTNKPAKFVPSFVPRCR